LVGQVGDHLIGHGPEQRLAGAGKRGQVGRRAAADQHTGRLLRVADPLLEPAEHHQLHLAGTSRLDPGAGLDVAGAGDKVSQDPRPGRDAGDVGEVAGVIVAAHERQDIAAELVEDALEALGAFRRGPTQPAGQLRRRLPTHHRLITEPYQPVDEHVHGREDQRCPRDVVGIDSSPEAVATAKARAQQRALGNVRFVMGDIHAPAPGGPFD
jgi:hypothetical protein